MSVQIFVRSYIDSNNTYTLDVHLSDSIRSVKQKLEAKLGIPWELQQITKRGGSSFPDDKSLAEWRVQNEDTLELLPLRRYNFAKYYSRMHGTLFEHVPNQRTCPNMKNSLSCNIHNNILNHKFSKELLEHMQLYSHCGLSIVDCRYGIECNAYQRLISGGMRLDDRCHVQVYSHPPRARRNQEFEDLDNNVYPLICAARHPDSTDNDESDEKKSNNNNGCRCCYINSVKDWDYPQTYVKHLLKLLDTKNCHNEKEIKEMCDKVLLKLLIKEVTKNGFDKELRTPKGKSLLDIVDENYMNHIRHIKMGKPLSRAEMLSIVLYTGCECNYAMCKSQRSGDYRKWIIFDYLLNNAISNLHDHERGEYAVYTGIGNCQIDFKKDIKIKECDYFMTTFMSASYDINVAKTFLKMNGSKGTIIGIGPSTKSSCIACDVSWISKFGNSEKEVLFARIQGSGKHQMIRSFAFDFVDNIGGIQRIRAAALCTNYWNDAPVWEKVFN